MAGPSWKRVVCGVRVSAAAVCVRVWRCASLLDCRLREGKRMSGQLAERSKAPV